MPADRARTTGGGLMDFYDQKPPRLALAMGKRFALAAVVVVTLSASATATAVLLQVHSVARELQKGHRPDVGREITPAEAGAPETFMILGSDRRASEGGAPGNSDTILLARLDPNKSSIALMSIPRDLMVTLRLRNGQVRPGQKINAAYALGGPRVALATVKQLLGIPINHVIDVNFGGFRHAVNYVGCIYTDVDRRYFNDNSGGEQYAQIDLQPGYQKLCDYNALAYVRYRHEDTDLVRAARQQDFLREAKDQLSAQKLFDDRNALIRIFAKYADTDIRGDAQIVQLIKLVAFSAGHPVREVHFRSTVGPSYVTASRRQIRQNVIEFLNEDVTRSPIAGPRTTAAQQQTNRRRPRRPRIPGGLEQAKSDGESRAIEAAPKTPFTFYYPTLRLTGSAYADNPRTYKITDLKHRRHSAYRMVLDMGTLGDFYGVQGMTWKNPPILAKPTGRQMINGRRFLLFTDGGRLRLVAWRTRRAVYWISNTLTLALNNDQMLAIAASTRPVGR
jgi:polyisoprenyl-teichoic acid--peptidoglycan teichoic acid transferase